MKKQRGSKSASQPDSKSAKGSSGKLCPRKDHPHSHRQTMRVDEAPASAEEPNRWLADSLADSLDEGISHPNRALFEGCLAVLDKLSDKAPSGARGHRVMLPRRAAEEALPSLIGMAVDCKSGWDGHDPRQKVGVITGARIVSGHSGDRLMVRGFVYARDFPEVAADLAAVDAAGLGMSYEVVGAEVVDMRAPTWVLKKVTFTGAAILAREHAAYRETSFEVRKNSESAS